MNFLNYNNTLNTRRNIDLFMDEYQDDILKLHEDQFLEEQVKGSSTKQYNVLHYYASLEYCVNLMFLILEKTEEETISDSEKEIKELYNYTTIQYNMAHMGIDLDTIFNNVKISYTPITMT